MKAIYLGIDIGNTKLALALSDGQTLPGEVLRLPTEARRGQAQALEKVLAGAKDLAARAPTPLNGIGISFGGMLDPGGRLAERSPNFPGWRPVGLVELFEQAFPGVPAAMENDANAAGLGELVYGRARGSRTFLYFTVSTGVGGAAFVDGRLVRGSRGLAAEFGHMIVEPDGAACTCGGRGCLEAYASGSSIARLGRERLAAGPGGRMRELCAGDPAALTAALVCRAAREGDPAGLEILASVSRRLGVGLANAAGAFDPELIVLGGGVMNSGSLILPGAVDFMQRHLLLRGMQPPPVLASEFPDDTALVGALAVARQAAGGLC